jgi:hypothetical protein
MSLSRLLVLVSNAQALPLLLMKSEILLAELSKVQKRLKK